MMQSVALLIFSLAAFVMALGFFWDLARLWVFYY